MNAQQTCHCEQGWICEEHPDQRYSHDNCSGPGMKCDNPRCPFWNGDPPRARQLDVVFALTSQAPTQKTGLVCPLCKEAYGAIEDQQPKRIVVEVPGLWAPMALGRSVAGATLMDFDPYQSLWRENVPPMTLTRRRAGRRALECVY
jgi:hypothetical protein